MIDINSIDAEWEKEWAEIWYPLIMTGGELDKQKVKNEMHDLWFVYKQVSEVYCELTGNKLSKPMYYAKTILDLYSEEIQRSYDEGYSHGLASAKDEAERMCNCGHASIDHVDDQKGFSEVGVGYNECTISGCGCQHFTEPGTNDHSCPTTEDDDIPY